MISTAGARRVTFSLPVARVPVRMAFCRSPTGASLAMTSVTVASALSGGITTGDPLSVTPGGGASSVRLTGPFAPAWRTTFTVTGTSLPGAASSTFPGVTVVASVSPEGSRMASRISRVGTLWWRLKAWVISS